MANWIDLGTRTNGRNAGQVIHCPGYIIESLLRDECFVERDLEIITKVSYQNYEMAFASSDEGYYNASYVVNITRNEIALVNYYFGANLQVSLDGAYASWSVGDKCFVFNIQGNKKIDAASFDVVGKTIDGSRKDWKFSKSINSKTDAYSLINEICYESFLMLHSVNGVYKLVALDAGPAVATLTKPLITMGDPQIKVDLTPLSEVYSSFRLKYNYNYAKGEYLQEYFCDKNSSTTGATGLSAYKTKCLNAETNYRVKRKFEYSANWIYDSATALAFIKKLMDWLTIQRTIINWSSSISDSIFNGSMLDIGDLVKVDYPLGKVLTYTLVDGGITYAVGNIITLIQTGGSNCTFRVDSVDGATGKILTMTMLTGGQGYMPEASLTTSVSPDIGSGALITVNTVTSPTIIPLSKNNSAIFMIYAKQINIRNGQPSIDYALLEMV